MKFTKDAKFSLTSLQSSKMEALLVTRPDKTPQELVTQIIEMGLYQIIYRKKMNKKNNELKKIGRASLEYYNEHANQKAMRDMAIGIGLIVDTDNEDEETSSEDEQ